MKPLVAVLALDAASVTAHGVDGASLGMDTQKGAQ